MNSDEHDLPTRLVHAGRDNDRFGGAVNPPIQKASTLLAKDVDALYGGPKSLYGRMGLSAQDCLKDGLCALENAKFCYLASNGLNACALAIASVLNTGDHILVSDAVYGPTRRFCEKFMARMGVSVTFIPPRSGADIERYIRPETKAVFLEAPGSLTFEMPDLDEILSVTKPRQIISILDNTWGAGVLLKPLDIGFDMVVQALTKYVIGHSDGFGGAVLTNSKKLSQLIETTAQEWGISLSAEDAYLAQRGLRSLHHRINIQGESAVKIANFLDTHPAVLSVEFPALPSNRDHAVWKKYYSGPSGLFGFVLKPCSQEKLKAFFDKLDLFSMGFSWGGFESLMIPCDPQLKRTESPDWFTGERGELIRISVGLESTDDLIADLDHALRVISE